MTGNLGIGIAVTLRDQVTSNMARVTQSMNQLYSRVTQGNLSNLNQIRDIGLALGTAAYGGMRAMQSAVQAAAGLETKLQSIKAIVIDSPNDRPFFKDLKKDFMDLSRIVPFNAEKLAEMGVNLRKAGVEAKFIPGVAAALAKGAFAYGEDIGGVNGYENMVVRIMAGMGIPFSETGKVSAQLGRASVEALGSPKDIFESFKYSQDIFKGLDFKLEEMLSAVVVLNNVGMQSSVGGISLANMFRELAKSTQTLKGQKFNALQSLGLHPKDFVDANGNLGRMMDIIQKLKTGLKGYGGVARVNILTDLFGVRGSRGANPLLDSFYDETVEKKDMKSYGQLQKLLLGTGNSDQEKAFAIRMETYAANLQLLNNEIFILKVNIGDALLPILLNFIRFLRPVVQVLSYLAETKFGKSLIYLAGAGIALSAAFAGLALSTYGLNQAMQMIRGGALGGAGGIGGGGGRMGPNSPWYGGMMYPNGSSSRVSFRPNPTGNGSYSNLGWAAVAGQTSGFIQHKSGAIMSSPGANSSVGYRPIPGSSVGGYTAVNGGVDRGNAFGRLFTGAIALTMAFQSLNDVLTGKNQKQRNAGWGGIIGGILGLAAGAYLKNPTAGAMIGGMIGSQFGGMFGSDEADPEAAQQDYNQRNTHRYFKSMGSGSQQQGQKVSLVVNIDGKQQIEKSINLLHEKQLVQTYNVEAH